MTGCNTGRNIQKYKGAGASTLQDALENGNTASLDVVLQSPAVFIGDGGGLSNINASSTTGNLQAVTNNGATSTTKITLTNSATSLETTGNIVVSTNVYATEFYGDGGTLSNIAANKNFQDVTTLGNTSSLTISFTNPAESITTTGNVIVGTNVHATEFVGDGSSLTSLNADNIDSGDLAIARGGTGVTTGISQIDPSSLTSAVSISKGGTGQTSASAAATALGLGTGNSPQFTGISLGSTAITESSGTVSIGANAIRTGDVALGTQTSGNYVSTVTGGNGIASTGPTNGENIAHTLSIDLKTNSGLEFDTNKLTVDLKNDGGIVLEGNELAVKLDASSITGKLAVADGGTGSNTLNNLIELGTHTTGNYVSTITGGDGITSTGTTNGENIAHTLSIDLKTNSGLVFESNKLAVDLSASDITGKLAVADGGSNNNSFTGGGVLYYDSSNTKFVSTAAGSNGDVLKVISGVPAWGSDNVSGSSGVGTLSQVTALGSSTNDKITLSNTNISLETSGNVVVGNNKFFKGDAGLLSNVTSGSVTINTSSANSENDIIFTTGSNNLDKDDNGRIKYNPDTNILTIKDASNRSNTLNSLSWSGNAASADKLSNSVKIGNVDFDGSANITPEKIQMSDSSTNTDFLIPFSSVTDNTSSDIKLHSDAGIFTYNPDSGTLKSNHFHGGGSNLTDISTSNLDGSVPVANGGTGRSSIANDSLLLGPSNTSDTSMKVLAPDISGTKYLQSTNGGISWQTVTATISINNNNTDVNQDLVFTTGSNSLDKDTNGGIKYNPSSSTLKIIDTSSRSNTLTSLSWSGNADSADKLSTARKIGNVDFNGTSDISLVSEENNTDTHRGVIFADGTNNNDLKHDNTEFKYNSAKGLLSVSNINATDTSTDARNSIANASLDHTLRVGTKIICEEEENSTHGDDALRVNGNVVVVDYILGNGRYLKGINIQQDSNGSDTFVTNDGAPSQSSRLSRFNA